MVFTICLYAMVIHLFRLQRFFFLKYLSKAKKLVGYHKKNNRNISKIPY